MKKNLLHLLFFTLGVLGTILAVGAYDGFLYTFFTGEEKTGHELWIAKEKINAYPAPYSKDILFEINEGEVCTPIKIVINKDMNIKVLCKNGEGWIHYWTTFDIIKAKEENMNRNNWPHFPFFILGVLSAILAVRVYNSFIYTFLVGEEKPGHELWIAKEKILAYPAPYDENVLYEINEGETCIPLKIIIGKATHIKVLCKNGEGWIHCRTKFDIIKTKEQK